MVLPWSCRTVTSVFRSPLVTVKNHGPFRAFSAVGMTSTQERLSPSIASAASTLKVRGFSIF
jgi:hypothetical protein